MRDTLLKDERVCPACDGGGALVGEGAAELREGFVAAKCSNCHGHGVQERCWVCREWSSYEPGTHACQLEDPS